ncbi:PA2169 family four-helix-bundle protein [Mucilaginibacter sp. RS28]|uniref:PA2169 family four-helix-bundle protein n=1 Tax=Mucilaginibacter straminoryzae TaxID=2932774 RepID=A0A9X2BA66_9SPHI|nr:PA2169 family four-helix-bundle protein [Mucilaginibacter straminoryzae]MCJ8208457.1 PA2169 family four-helix-bundle protein [Mucilaginibacter straminoryzae]
METIEKSVEVLSELVELNNSRAEGFEKASSELSDNDTDLKPLFQQYAEQSRKFSQELNDCITGLGSNYEKGEMTSGAIHRVWIDIKSMFTGHDRAGILGECERGEDSIKKAYTEAIQGGELSPEVSGVVAAQAQEINMEHDRIKLLRDTAK